MADGTSGRVLSLWPFYVHAAVTGILWVPGMLVLAFIPPWSDWLLALPPVVLGPLILAGAPFVLPPMWPVFIAGAWRELMLIERIDRSGGRRALANHIRLYVAGFGLITVLSIGGSGAAFGQWGTAVSVAWIGPLIVTGIHWLMYRWVRPQSRS